MCGLMPMRFGSAKCVCIVTRRNHSLITTPIFYANAAPHIGHLYTAVIGDASHRWARLRHSHEKAIFATGTDEHGSKIARSAALAGMEPQAFCDNVSGRFRMLFEKFGIGYTDFIRTTEGRHKKVVQNIWMKLCEADTIYKDTYSGWYSIVDECFYHEADVETITRDEKPIKVAKETHTAVEWVEEQNYMFKLGMFKEHTRNHLSDVIYPKHYLNSALNALNTEDALSISRDRKRLQWGIPVPGDDNQTIYVWLDALANYLTVNNYPNLSISAPSCQIIGKDIIKFHTVYWFAFLKALNLSLPKRLFVHGHWLVNGVKMSKSLGNVVNPMEAANYLTSEGLRYFLLKQGVPTDDSNYTTRKAIEVINNDLVNTIGNLLNRATVPSMNQSQTYPHYQEGVLSGELRKISDDIISDLNQLTEQVSPHYDSMCFYRGLDVIMGVVRKGNVFMQRAAPWKMIPGPEMNCVLFVCYEVVRIVSVFLSPIVPKFSQHALDRLNVPTEHSQLSSCLFGGVKCSLSGNMLGAEKGPYINRIQMPTELEENPRKMKISKKKKTNQS